MAGLRSIDLPVGAEVLVAQASGPPLDRADRVVVLVHGITANGLCWPLVQSRLPTAVATIAPDLRGRGASSALPGPYGLDRHVEDLEAGLAALGAPRVVLAGHAMGAFVATAFASRHPDRVDGLVLVDGGLPGPVPDPDSDPEELLQRALGPAFDRLGRVFGSDEDVCRSWQAHPAFADRGGWNEIVAASALHDVGGPSTARRSRVSTEAVRADGLDLLTEPDRSEAIESLTVPMELVRVERGLDDGPHPVVPFDAAVAAERRIASLRVVTVPNLNHYGIVFQPQGADAVAAAIGRVLARSAQT